MQTFRYLAVNVDGRQVRGRVLAQHLADVELQLQRRALALIDARPVGAWLVWHKKRVSRQDIITFCFHLEQLLSAGVPLVEALQDLCSSVNDPLQSVLAHVLADIENGANFSQALAQHPAFFDVLFVRLIAAAEVAGQLPRVLLEIIDNLRWQDETDKQIKRALLYPMMVCGVLLGAFLVILLYVVPQLAVFIQEMYQEIPLQTRILLWMSDTLLNHGFWLLLIPVSIILLFVFWRKTDHTAALRMDRLKLKIWLLGSIMKQVIMARFAYFMALLYASGISVLDCIKISERIVGNQAVAADLHQIRQRIEAGQGISESFALAQMFPPLVLRMIKVGETTGALDVALRNVHRFYAREAKESMERLIVMLSPSLILILALLWGWVIMSLLGPIYNLIETITAV